MRPILAMAALLLVAGPTAGAGAERASVRDARYCELLIVRRAGLVARVGRDPGAQAPAIYHVGRNNLSNCDPLDA